MNFNSNKLIIIFMIEFITPERYVVYELHTLDIGMK